MNLAEYKKMFIKRYDDNHLYYYFSAKDFNGLEAKPIEFKNCHNDTLKGFIYSYPGYKQNQLVIFSHGIDGGHLSYMKEIEKLCKNHFQVLAYDNTGCMESEGSSIYAMTEALADLVSAIKFIRDNQELSQLELSIIGHSWGAYATLNSLNYFNDIKHIVAISGFPSLQMMASMITQNEEDLRDILNFEREVNPQFIDSSALDVLNKTSTKALIIHSYDDTRVPYLISFKVMKDSVNNPNIRFLVVDGKGHNPNYSKDALEYMKEAFTNYSKMKKNNEFKSYIDEKAYMDKLDWNRMTMQDESIWKEIINCLNQ